MATSNRPSPENLHERYQLALRASSAAIAASDPGDTLALWTAVAGILDMSIVTLRQLGAPVPADRRIYMLGGIGEQLEAAHTSVHKIGRWTRQVHRVLAASTADQATEPPTEGEAEGDTSAEAAPEPSLTAPVAPAQEETVCGVNGHLPASQP
jgi:hypothetical protein